MVENILNKRTKIMSNNSQKGFTLVELSIVIVIIGLIVAGVVAGQSLVKQAQLRSIITEQEAIRVSLNTFKLEYDAIPGDFEAALSYWPAAATDGCNVAGTGNSDADECPGDGNGQILIVAGDNNEGYMAWKHLELAGLYSGSFVPGAAITGTINGNIPASKYTGAGITLVYDESTTLGASQGDGTGAGGSNIGKNVILFGGAVASDIANATIFTPNQVKGIDTKVDDGAPVVGTVRAVGLSSDASGVCIDADGAAAANGATYESDDTYNLDTDDASPCAIAFTL